MSRIDADVTVTRLVDPHPQEYPIPIPQFDLTEHATARYSGEWRVGRRRLSLGLGCPIAATWYPWRDHTVVRIHRGFRRNEIPELIALLSVVYAEAWPEPDATTSLGGANRGAGEGGSAPRHRRRGPRSR